MLHLNEYLFFHSNRNNLGNNLAILYYKNNSLEYFLFIRIYLLSIIIINPVNIDILYSVYRAKILFLFENFSTKLAFTENNNMVRKKDL